MNVFAIIKRFKWIALIFVFILIWFVLVDSSDYYPRKTCTLTPGLACLNNFSFAADRDSFYVMIENGIGRDLSIFDISLQGEDTPFHCQYGGTVHITNGESKGLSMECTPFEAKDVKSGRFWFNLTYTYEGGTIPHPIRGEVVLRNNLRLP